MKTWIVYFYDKHSDETRSLQVTLPDGTDEDAVGEAAIKEADERGWPASFRLGDVVPLDQ